MKDKHKNIINIIIIILIIIFGILFGITYMLIDYHQLGNDFGTILGFILASSIVGFITFLSLLFPKKNKDKDNHEKNI